MPFSLLVDFLARFHIKHKFQPFNICFYYIQIGMNTNERKMRLKDTFSTKDTDTPSLNALSDLFQQQQQK